ncbi:unnamed protein product [Effrenium voratum]|nr:unnamed protein product [Effrenium voratum]
MPRLRDSFSTCCSAAVTGFRGSRLWQLVSASVTPFAPCIARALQRASTASIASWNVHNKIVEVALLRKRRTIDVASASTFDCLGLELSSQAFGEDILKERRLRLMTKDANAHANAHANVAVGSMASQVLFDSLALDGTSFQRRKKSKNRSQRTGGRSTAQYGAVGGGRAEGPEGPEGQDLRRGLGARRLARTPPTLALQGVDRELRIRESVRSRCQATMSSGSTSEARDGETPI